MRESLEKKVDRGKRYKTDSLSYDRDRRHVPEERLTARSKLKGGRGEEDAGHGEDESKRSFIQQKL